MAPTSPSSGSLPRGSAYVVVRDGAAVLHDLFSGGVLDLAVDLHRVLESALLEAEVDVDAGARVVDLRDSAREEGLARDSALLALVLDALLDVLAQLRHVLPGHRQLERLREEAVLEPEVAQVGDRERQEVAALSVLGAYSESEC